MDLENISDELKEKAKTCKSPEELLALAQSEGIELSDEQIASVSGGLWIHRDTKCPEDTDSDLSVL